MRPLAVVFVRYIRPGKPENFFVGINAISELPGLYLKRIVRRLVQSH